MLNYKKRFFILFCVVVFFVCSINIVRAVDLEENFDYSDGDIQAQNGGTGWSEAWGATTACSGTYFNVVSDVLVQTLGNSVCERKLDVLNSDDINLDFLIRAPQTNKDTAVDWWNVNHLVLGIRMRATGQISVYNDTTDTNLMAYSADTWYCVRVNFISWSAETFRISVNEGIVCDDDFSSTYHTYDYVNNDNSQIDRIHLKYTDDSGSLWIDSIFLGTVEEPPVGGEVSGFASSTQDMLYALEWQYMIFWEVVFLGVGTLFTVGVMEKFI